MARVYPREALTKDEARLRHPEGELFVMSMVTEEGDLRKAIFIIFPKRDDGDAKPPAFYWLAPTKFH